MASSEEHRQETAVCQLGDAVVAAYLRIVTMYGLRPFKDGDQWCYLLGKNIQEGVCGFGKTPYEAAQNFHKVFTGEYR